MSERKAVFLVGPMGAGKSTLGRQLGHRFEGGFVDLDDYIVKVAGKSIPKIFEEDGEPYFRQLEHDCLEAILTGKSERIAPEFIKDPLPTIIAGGGGVRLLRGIHVFPGFQSFRPEEVVDRIYNGLYPWKQVTCQHTVPPSRSS